MKSRKKSAVYNIQNLEWLVLKIKYTFASPSGSIIADRIVARVMIQITIVVT